MKSRRVISLTMLFSFIVMAYTGVMLYITPHGRVANWTGWHMLGLDKEQYGKIHTTFMLVFLVAGIWHIVLNWKIITKYLKNKARKIPVFGPEFNVAIVLNLVFLLGTLAGWPPWSSFLDVGEAIKDYWERRDGSPPWGHAEENTLSRFSRGLVDWERIEHQKQVSLSVDDVIAELREEGVTVESGAQQLSDIAHENDTTPQALMEIIRRAERPVTDGAGVEIPVPSSDEPYPRPMSGLGRMTLRAYCERYELDLEQTITLLGGEAPIDPDSRLREIAEERDTDSETLIDRLNERARAGASQEGAPEDGGPGGQDIAEAGTHD